MRQAEAQRAVRAENGAQRDSAMQARRDSLAQVQCDSALRAQRDGETQKIGAAYAREIGNAAYAHENGLGSSFDYAGSALSGAPLGSGDLDSNTFGACALDGRNPNNSTLDNSVSDDNIAFGEGAPVQETHSITSFIGLRTWGFAFIRAWVYLMFLGMGIGVLGFFPSTFSSSIYLWSSAALCVTLFAGAFAPERLERVLTSTKSHIFSIALTTVGTLCVVFAFFTGPAQDVFISLGGASTGIGSGLIHLGYGELHRDRPPSEVGIEVPMAALFAAVIFAGVSFLSFVAQVIIVSVLPIASGAILIAKTRTSPRRKQGLPHATNLILPTPKLILRIGLCAAGIGIADGIVRQVFMASSKVAPFDFYHPGMLTSSIVLAILLVAFEMGRHGATFRAMYKLITFVIAASIAFMPAFIDIPNCQWLGPFSTLVGYNAFNVFMWILLADLTYNFRLSAAATFGVGWGMLTIGSTAGQMLGGSLTSSLEFTPQVISVVSACATLVVFAVSLFIMRDTDLVDLKDQRLMIENVGLQSADDIEDEEEIESEKNDKIAKEDEQVRTPFRDRCSKLATRYDLTPRETEILILFAKGRSAARIQQDLVISRGTVTTHLQHIYRKTDVHSKQELLDLIEAQREEEN